jgi:hypothetical protein
MILSFSDPTFDTTLFWKVSIAFIGGTIAFAGLWMEHRKQDALFSNILEMRRYECKAKWGWRILMTGIAIETLVAGWAAFDEWENNLLNRPISSVSADVFFISRGLGSITASPFAISIFQTNDFSRTNEVEYDFNNPKFPSYKGFAYGIPEKFQSGLPTMFIAGLSSVSQDGIDTKWKLKLGQNSLDSPLPNGSVKSMFDWNLFEIKAGFLSPKTEILGGEIKMTVNNETRIIDIPKQTVLSHNEDWQNFSNNPQAGVRIFGQ